jgi:hypothetical protein
MAGKTEPDLPRQCQVASGGLLYGLHNAGLEVVRIDEEVHGQEAERQHANQPAQYNCGQPQPSHRRPPVVIRHSSVRARLAFLGRVRQSFAAMTDTGPAWIDTKIHPSDPAGVAAHDP